MIPRNHRSNCEVSDMKINDIGVAHIVLKLDDLPKKQKLWAWYYGMLHFRYMHGAQKLHHFYSP